MMMACKRKGMGRGRGKGYRNLIGKDKKVHSDSAKGRKQPQRIPEMYKVKGSGNMYRAKFPDKGTVTVKAESWNEAKEKIRKEVHGNLLKKQKKMTEKEYQEELNEILWEQRNNCPECMDMKMQGMAGACQYHLDQQFDLYNRMHPEEEDPNQQPPEDLSEEEPEPDPRDMDDYDDEVANEWHAENDCIKCGTRYHMSDMSPDYVKGGYCSRGCAEAGGYFGTNLKKGNVPDSKFDKKQLKRGIEVEMEHTDDPAIAKKIAKAHLAEFPDYYTRLDKMEKEAEKEIGILDKNDKQYLGEHRDFTENKYG